MAATAVDTMTALVTQENDVLMARNIQIQAGMGHHPGGATCASRASRPVTSLETVRNSPMKERPLLTDAEIADSGEVRPGSSGATPASGEVPVSAKEGQGETKTTPVDFRRSSLQRRSSEGQYTQAESKSRIQRRSSEGELITDEWQTS